MTLTIPEFVQQALGQLKAAGFEAFVVGGAVRDLVIDRDPKDFDMTTNATPEQIQEVFEDTLYNNDFGTVAVRMIDQEGVRHEIEVTPYRAEQGYADHRHPDKIEFGVSLEEDLKRRDFTINAMAFDGEKLIDPFGGQEDCRAKLIRTVGKPEDRFGEDALRMMRATRFAAQLSFKIDTATLAAIQAQSKSILKVSWERIRDEFMKTVAADNAFRGIWQMHQTDLLAHIVPELEKGVGVDQNLHHIYTIFMHGLLSMQYCPSDEPLVKLAALLHDIGKPETKEGKGMHCTFYNHEHLSAKLTRDIMQRLKFSKKDTERVMHLVKNHMFYYVQGEITDAGVRRLVKRIGRENLDDFMNLRIGDRMGSGCQKEKPFKLVELERRIREVEKDPMDTTMLKIDGHDIMELTQLKPGREIGQIMNALLEDVLEDPSLNTKEYLNKRAQEIFSDLVQAAKEK